MTTFPIETTPEQDVVLDREIAKGTGRVLADSLDPLTRLELVQWVVDRWVKGKGHGQVEEVKRSLTADQAEILRAIARGDLEVVPVTPGPEPEPT